MLVDKKQINCRKALRFKKVIFLSLVILLLAAVVVPSVNGEVGEEKDEGNKDLHHWLAIISSVLLFGSVVGGIVLYFGKFSERYSELRLLHALLGILTLLFFLLTSWIMI